MKYEVIFESERIMFAKLSEKLVQKYLDMINDENIQMLISKDMKKYTFEQEIEWIKEKINKNAIIFSMIEKETNDFIGNIELMNIKDNTGELGITITKNKQDNHFGQEAIKALLNYAFNILKLEKVELNVFSYNQRAIHCYKKIGFIKDGIGKTVDDIHMVMLK